MLDDEVSVQQNGFDFRERGIIAIDIAPARLHHGELFVREIGHRAAQKIRGRNKIRIEDGHKFTGRRFQAFLQRTGFIAFAVVAMDVTNGHSEGPVAFYTVAGDLAGLVGRIVENLNLEQLARIVELRNGFDKPFDDVAFVINGELNGDFGPGSYLRRRPRNVLSIFIIVVNQGVAVNAVGSQNDHYEKIRQHDCKIEGIQLVNSAEWIEFGVHVPAPVVGERAGGSKPGSHPRRRVVKQNHEFIASRIAVPDGRSEPLVRLRVLRSRRPDVDYTVARDGVNEGRRSVGPANAAGQQG